MVDPIYTMTCCFNQAKNTRAADKEDTAFGSCATGHVSSENCLDIELQP